MYRFRLFFFAIALPLCGCASSQNIADRASAFNNAQATAATDEILLNILRTRAGKLRAYSHLDALHGESDTQQSVTLGFPLAGDVLPGFFNNSQLFGPSLNGGAYQATSGDFSPQDGHDFYQQILTPVSLQEWALYQDQGSPPELLFYLFVSRIEMKARDYANIDHAVAQICRSASGTAEAQCRLASEARADASAGVEGRSCLPAGGGANVVIENDVNNACAMLGFELVMHQLEVLGFHVEKSTGLTAVGPKLSASSFKTPDWPFKLSGASVVIESAGNRYQVKQVTTDYTPRLSALDCGSGVSIAVSARSEVADSLHVMGEEPPSGQPGCRASVRASILISTRSPDAIVAYLGAAARAQLPLDPGKPSQSVVVKTEDGRKPLLTLSMNDANSLANIEYDDIKYSVPPSDSFTMPAIQLLHQMFALANKTPHAAAVAASD